jgi:uncharacterized membrane protein YgdD (TMEM256/DUF423 family)
MATQRLFLVLAAAAGALGVILGAFGAHALRSRLPADRLAAFETGVRYQMYHAFALIAVAWLMQKYPESSVRLAGWFFVAGILLFSGSLYLLATRALLGIEGWKWLGPVTPLGGLFLIAGWITVLVSCLGV